MSDRFAGRSRANYESGKEFTMKTSSLKAAASVAIVSVALMAMGHSNKVMVGGQSMLPSMTIVDNAKNSADHTTLVAAVKAADLVETLQSDGPFTVFAPTNAAFAELPDGTVDSLLKPENKQTLARILTYHVVAGQYDSAAIKALIKKGNGKAEIKTVSGDKLTARWNGPANVVVTDEQGNAANISTYDVYQSNGIIHVVDAVLMPE